VGWLKQCGHFSDKGMDGESIFFRFCADVFYGRLKTKVKSSVLSFIVDFHVHVLYIP